PVARGRRKLPNPLAVGAAGPVVDGRDRLEQAEPGGGGGGLARLGVVGVGGAGGGGAAGAFLDRRPSVGGPVSRRGDAPEVEAGENTNAAKSVPLVAFDAVLDPARIVVPVSAEVAGSLAQPRPERRAQLRLEDMDLGFQEVGQAAGMIRVEVGDDDVADVAT